MMLCLIIVKIYVRCLCLRTPLLVIASIMCYGKNIDRVAINGKMVGFTSGLCVGLFISGIAFTSLQYRDMGAYFNATEKMIASAPDQCSKPQIYNFMKEFGNREHHLDVPKILKTGLNYGKDKVVVDIGLDDGQEFFAAINSGYSVYGFEANSVSAAKLRKRCEEYDGKLHGPLRCMYVNAGDIKEHLPPKPLTSYLIEGGAGASKSVLNMSISGPGSSFVEIAPGTKNPVFKMVNVIPISDVVDADVYFFKLDVQGFEFDVLRGAKPLFDKKIVKTMVMEVYPRGLGNAGTDFDDFLNFIWDDLGMLCSSSNPISSNVSFGIEHPNSLPDFSQYLRGLTNATLWGQFDDFTCFNRLKTWI